jgi:hypothetical protein
MPGGLVAGVASGPLTNGVLRARASRAKAVRAARMHAAPDDRTGRNECDDRNKCGNPSEIG